MNEEEEFDDIPDIETDDFNNDVTEEETVEKAETEEETKKVDNKIEKEEELPQAYKFKIKVDHEEKEEEFKEDQIITALQKEKNYDRITQKNSELEVTNKWLLSRAQKAGFKDIASYTKAVEEAEIQTAISSIMEEKSIDLETATEIVKARLNKEEKTKKEMEEETKNQENLEYDKFLKKFPDVDVSKIPLNVFKKVNEEGMTLTEAYLEYKLEETKANLTIKNKENENKNKAVINGVSTHAVDDNAEVDLFLQGFNSD